VHTSHYVNELTSSQPVAGDLATTSIPGLPSSRGARTDEPIGVARLRIRAAALAVVGKGRIFAATGVAGTEGEAAAITVVADLREVELVAISERTAGPLEALRASYVTTAAHGAFAAIQRAPRLFGRLAACPSKYREQPVLPPATAIAPP